MIAGGRTVGAVHGDQRAAGQQGAGAGATYTVTVELPRSRCDVPSRPPGAVHSFLATLPGICSRSHSLADLRNSLSESNCGGLLLTAVPRG